MTDQADNLYNNNEEKEEEEEEEEDEFHVIIDLGSEMTTTTLDSAVDYEIQGIDTAEPILRIGIHYFKGTWDLMVGTDLIFAPTSENKQPQETAPHAQLVAKSTKILRCQLMQLQPHPV